ncbi:carboxylesterase/lipase family protein [Lacisediminihabitans profunda]|uniref:carboxylesterase/lipase family protein n=1 Tax=Lacisediminihabitans profunda TaxID=2594790 RepID=UPI001650C5AC|nr:carboxylesterase family protein [Lacisediminihabitans profunda]
MNITAETEQGTVVGTRGPLAVVFHGVPYAAPPVGRARFEAPAPPPHWSGERDARLPGPNAPQPRRDRFGQLDLSPFFADGWHHGDDYLTLSISAPPEAHRAPVVVWVHGGAFLAGSTRAPAYDGESFARDGVVFVGVNLRVGAAGFLRLPDAPDNRGVLDVAAALGWVQRNIAAFGGDPGAVTLMGQSAGAIIVMDLLGRPDIHTLISRAIVQSGTGLGGLTGEQADVVTGALAAAIGVAPSAAGLADVSDEELVAAFPRLMDVDITRPGARAPMDGIVRYGVVSDRQPLVSLPDGAGVGIPLLIGSNLDEAALYVPQSDRSDASAERALHAAAARLNADPDTIVEAYWRPDRTPDEAHIALLSDGMFGLGTRLFAEAHSRAGLASTYVYEFEWRSDALQNRLGASHLMELPFVFDNARMPSLHGPDRLLGDTPPPRDLAERMHDSWIRFVTEGDPGWPAFTGPDGPVQRIGRSWTVQHAHRSAEFAAWGR